MRAAEPSPSTSWACAIETTARDDHVSAIRSHQTSCSTPVRAYVCTRCLKAGKVLKAS